MVVVVDVVVVFVVVAVVLIVVVAVVFGGFSLSYFGRSLELRTFTCQTSLHYDFDDELQVSFSFVSSMAASDDSDPS